MHCLWAASADCSYGFGTASELAHNWSSDLMKFPVPPKLFFRSVGVGILAAIALGALAFAAAPFFDAVAVYIAPAIFVAPVIGAVIPSRLVYWLIPDGGAAAGMLLILFSAVLFWSIFFGAIYFVWAASKRRRAIPETNSR